MISESMMKKYFDRWTDSSYGDDVVTTSIGYNYIDEKEDYEMQLWYLEDPTKKNEEQKKLGLKIYSLSMRKDVVSVRDTELIDYDIVKSDEHFEYHTDSFVHLMRVLRKFYPNSVDDLPIVDRDSFIKQMSNILQNFCTQNNLPQYDPDDLLYGQRKGVRIPLTEKQKNFLYNYKSLWKDGGV
jgi:CRISPR/Cas system-associated protein Cas5 (RAMP superfamily)